MKQQGRQLDTGLPTSGKTRKWLLKIGTLEFKHAGHFPTSPIGLSAIAHQELKSVFTREKRIMLAQIPKTKPRMPNDLARIEFFFIEQNSKQRRFASPVSPDKADLDVVHQSTLGIVEQHLLAIVLVCVLDLK